MWCDARGSLLLAIAGLMMKWKLVAWLAVLCCLSSVVNIRHSEAPAFNNIIVPSTS